MAEFPALPLFTDAYLADTRHLTTEEHGAYLLLMMEAWRRPDCNLPDDDRLLARLSGLSVERWAEVRNIIMAFWQRDGRRKTWTQKRLVKERVFVAQKSSSQRDKAVKRWKETKKDDATALPNGCPDDAPTPTPTLIKEETNVSSKKRGSRLPDDWRLPRDLGDWAVSEGMAETEVRRQAAMFADYWRSVPASRGVKLDWAGTWRNWVRKALDDMPKQKPKQPDHFGAFGAIREVG